MEKYWIKIGMGTCKMSSKAFSSDKELPCLLMQFISLMLTFFTSTVYFKKLSLLFVLSHRKIMSCLQFLFRFPCLLQFKHLIFWFFWKFLQTTSPIQVLASMRDLISGVFLIHSAIDTNSVSKGLVTPLHFELAFSKVKNAINICLTIGSYIIHLHLRSIFGKKSKLQCIFLWSV